MVTMIFGCVIRGKTLKRGFLRCVCDDVRLGPICPGIWSYSPLDSWAKESYVVPDKTLRYCIQLLVVNLLSLFLQT